MGMLSKFLGGSKEAKGPNAQQSASADATERRKEQLRSKFGAKKEQRRAKAEQRTANDKSLSGSSEDYNEKFGKMAKKVTGR